MNFKKQRRSAKRSLRVGLAAGLIVVSTGYFLYELKNLERQNAEAEFKSIPRLSDSTFYPVSPLNLEVVHHSAYVLGFNDAYKTAAWVFHRLDKNDFVNAVRFRRSNRFRADPLLLGRSALPQDYTNSGYDRGHLAPAADFSYNEELLEESFFMSNIAPQTPALNRYLWRKIEEWVRQSLMRHELFLVYTGPVYDSAAPDLLERAPVAVPDAFYKIIYNEQNNTVIAFIAQNVRERPADETIKTYTVSVDDIEQRSGLNFFAGFAGEESFEAAVNTAAWF
jgi:endonuclease G